MRDDTPEPRTRSATGEWLSATWFLVAVLGLVGSLVVAARSAPADEPLRSHPRIGPAATPSPRPPLSPKVPPPPRGSLYWGAFAQGADRNPVRLVELDRTAGRRPAILMWFQSWAGFPSFPVQRARLLAHFGIVPMVTWEPWGATHGAPRISLRAVASGRYDAYLRRYARGVRAYGGPLFFRPMHEMDGDWYPWSGTWPGNSPDEFVRAWRHVHDVFRRAGADNATWVWSVNSWSVPHVAGNEPWRYWPGPAFVDWVAVSGFDSGPVRLPFLWQSFDAVMRTRYEELLRYGKPMMVAETGAPETGGDKAAWIRDAFASIHRSYPALGAIVWYDQPERGAPTLGDWRIDSSPSALAAFRAAIGDPRVRSAPAAVRRTGRA